MTVMTHTISNPPIGDLASDARVAVYPVGPGGRPNMIIADEVHYTSRKILPVDANGRITFNGELGVDLPPRSVSQPDFATWCLEVQTPSGRVIDRILFYVPDADALIVDHIVATPNMQAWTQLGIGPPGEIGPPGAGFENIIVAGSLAYPTIAAAVAAAVAGQSIWLIPGMTYPYAAGEPLEWPAGVGYLGHTGAKIVTTHVDGGVIFPEMLDVDYWMIRVHGSDVSQFPLEFGSDPFDGHGAKSNVWGVRVSGTGAGGIGVLFRHLQNCDFHSLRSWDNDLAQHSAKYTDGSKNVTFFGHYVTDCDEEAWAFDTDIGTQRSSKPTLYSDGLSEKCNGWKICDVELLRAYNAQLNKASATSEIAFHLLAGGNRDGDGVHGPDDILIVDGGTRGYKFPFQIDANAGNVVLTTGGMEFADQGANEVEALYRVLSPTARIRRRTPHVSIPPTAVRFDDGGSAAVEREVLEGEYDHENFITDDYGTPGASVLGRTVDGIAWVANGGGLSFEDLGSLTGAQTLSFNSRGETHLQILQTGNLVLDYDGWIDGEAAVIYLVVITDDDDLTIDFGPARTPNDVPLGGARPAGDRSEWRIKTVDAATVDVILVGPNYKPDAP